MLQPNGRVGKFSVFRPEISGPVFFFHVEGGFKDVTVDSFSGPNATNCKNSCPIWWANGETTNYTNRIYRLEFNGRGFLGLKSHAQDLAKNAPWPADMHDFPSSVVALYPPLKCCGPASGRLIEIKHGIREVALNDAMFQPKPWLYSNQKWGTVHQRNSLKGDFNRKRDDTVMTSHYKNATWPAHVEGQHLPEAGGHKSIPWKFKIE